jgi:GNAT superfamily N-acetyltransferase
MDASRAERLESPMLEYVGLGSRPLDLAFRTRAAARVRIVEFPGRWMAASDQARLLVDLRSVVRGTVPGGSLDYGVLTGSRERWAHAILTLIYDGERAVAFNALTVLPCELRGQPVDVLHLGLAIVHPDYQGRGFSSVLYGLTCFLIFARRQLRPLWISSVTQVPAIAGLVGENFERVFPNVRSDTRRSFDHVVLAREIMSRHRAAFGVAPEAGFDEDRFVITNAYTGGSDNLKKRFEEAPAARNPAFNALCQRELDYDRGDDFLQIGQWGLATTRVYFLRMAPTISPLRLAIQFLFLALESAIAPLLQWLKVQVAMGDIRPWPGRRS